MKTLLQINSCCNVGSTGKISEQIGRTAIARGWDSYIAYGRAGKESESHSIRIGSTAGVACNGLLTRIFDGDGLYARKATKKLVRIIEEIKPDVVQLHNIHGYFINYPLLFDCLKELDVKVVWTFHDCWAFTGHCAHFNMIECKKWKNHCYSCPLKKSYPSSWLFDRSRYLYGLKKDLFTSVRDMTIVSPSEWLADLVRESFLGKYPVKVINNGIDIDVFKPRKSDFKTRFGIEDKKIVLGVARVWSNSKGLDVFVELAKRLDESYKIVLVGTTAQIDKLLPKSIISIHRTNNQIELAELYSVASVYVNPTRSDTFPTVNLEARACGTPVITFPVGGSPESAGKDAIIVQDGDMDALIRAIEALSCRGEYEDKERELLSSEVSFQKYIDLYNE